MGERAPAGNCVSELEVAQAQAKKLIIAEHTTILERPRNTVAEKVCENSPESRETGEGRDDGRASAGSAATPIPKQRWWHVNKGGFPIPEATWERMWQYVEDAHPNGKEVAKNIRGQPCKKVPFPSVPTVTSLTPPEEALRAIQSYLEKLQYNHTGTQFFEIKKNRPLSRLMETGKEMIQVSLPIKCLEAVVVSLYLTAPLTSVQRLAISFKSKCADMYYRHIVLAVCRGGQFGALGLSRRRDLMYKPVHHKSLADLIQEFITCYKNYTHEVVKVRLSAAVPHDLHSCEQIRWKYLSLRVSELQCHEMKRTLDRFSCHIKTMSSTS